MKVYILASTERPDPYINVLACLFKLNEKREPISEIILLQKKDEKSQSNVSLKSNIKNELQKLSEGSYKSNTCLFGEDRKYYMSLLSKFNACNIGEKEMDDENYYKEIIQETKNKEKVIFDITTLKKDTLINIVSYFLANKINNVYYFDILKKPNYDEKDLIHNLTQKDFSYENVFENKHIEKSINQLTRTSNFMKIGISVSSSLAVLLFILVAINDQYASFIGIVGSLASLISLAALFIKKN